jgi:predicted transcriptional regulator
MTKENDPHNHAELAAVAQVSAAYLQNNQVELSKVHEVVSTVRAALFGGAAGATNGSGSPLPTEPAVDPNKSIFPDRIICLFDGKSFKTLKRHLWSTYNMTPEQYRAHFGLPNDYPMVAPNYAAHRSELARSHGLGRGATRGK